MDGVDGVLRLQRPGDPGEDGGQFAAQGQVDTR
jgi:hypothetical protein